MNKICTDTKQSQKLIELGIDVNTADMCWQNNEFPIGFNDDDAIPAWSLSALLDLLPNHIKVGRCITFLNIYKRLNYGWVIEYLDIKEDIAKYSFDGHILIDVCYKMIIKLKEQKLL